MNNIYISKLLDIDSYSIKENEKYIVLLSDHFYRKKILKSANKIKQSELNKIKSSIFKDTIKDEDILYNFYKIEEGYLFLSYNLLKIKEYVKQIINIENIENINFIQTSLSSNYYKETSKGKNEFNFEGDNYIICDGVMNSINNSDFESKNKYTLNDCIFIDNISLNKKNNILSDKNKNKIFKLSYILLIFLSINLLSNLYKNNLLNNTIDDIYRDNPIYKSKLKTNSKIIEMEYVYNLQNKLRKVINLSFKDDNVNKILFEEEQIKIYTKNNKSTINLFNRNNIILVNRNNYLKVENDE